MGVQSEVELKTMTEETPDSGKSWRLIKDVVPNYRHVDIELCRTCSYSWVDWDGVDWCIYPELATGTEEEVFATLADWNGKCDFYKKKGKGLTQLETARSLRDRANEIRKRAEKISEDLKNLFKAFPIPDVPDDDKWKDYRPEEENEWICSDCGAPSKLVATGFLDYVKPKCTVCGSGNATVVSKQENE